MEAGQKIIDLDPHWPEVSTAGDEGGLQARSLLSQLLAKETNLKETAAE